MENTKFLDIVFENCESIVIPINRIIEFTYGESIQLSGEMFNDGNYYRTDEMSLKISYQDESELIYNDMDYNHPLGMFVSNPISNNIEDRPNILGRLFNHQDVVGVRLLDELQEPFKIIYAPWGGEGDYTNTYMSIKAENGIIEIDFQK